MTDPSINTTVVLGGAAQGTYMPPDTTGDIQTALPIGTRMAEFEIVGLIGEGGFGIVYLAQDHSLQRQVALKEYMPASLATRGANSTVTVRSERLQETFDLGRKSFVNEARLLAQFDHPSLVKVYRFWEANGTAYMVMPFYDGTTLRDLLQKKAEAPDESWLRQLLDPLTRALATIHAHNCYHRDIAPDNIMLLPEGRPVLLDFGAARRVIGDMTQALTVILKPGYAPIEQYAEMPNMKQGAWTDIYALAAVVYYAILRRLPPPSVSRIMQDNYEPLASLPLLQGRYSDTFLKGIDHCLAVRPEQRPQTIDDMRTLLGIQSTARMAPPQSTEAVTKDTRAASSTADLPEEEIIAEINVPQGKRKVLWLLGTIAALTICMTVFSAVWLSRSSPKEKTRTAETTELSPAAIPPEPVANSAPAELRAQIPGTTESLQDKNSTGEPSADKTPLNPAGLHLVPVDSATGSTAASSKAAPPSAPRQTVRPVRSGTQKDAADSTERDYLKVNKDLDEMLR